MIVERQFAAQGHIVRLAVEPEPMGWTLREELDSALIHIEHCKDWQDVERTMRRIEMNAVRDGVRARVAHYSPA